MLTIKQTSLIRRRDEGREIRQANLRYVYLLTAFVSIGALLFGYGKALLKLPLLNRVSGR